MKFHSRWAAAALRICALVCRLRGWCYALMAQSPAMPASRMNGWRTRTRTRQLPALGVLRLVAGVLLVLTAGAAQAVDKYWICGGSSTTVYYWDASSCWSPSGVPASGDSTNVYLTQSRTTDTLIQYRNNLSNSVDFNSLTLDATGAGDITLSQGNKTINVGLGGLRVGVSLDGTGSYRLYGTGALTSINSNIGEEGTGIFEQSGGTHTISNYLTLGHYLSSRGEYYLDAGNLTVKTALLGWWGDGYFEQSGGTHNASWLHLGYEMGSGSYYLSGGSLSVANNEFIGNGYGYSGSGSGGYGSFSQTGGTHTVNNVLYLGYYENSIGNYFLSGTGDLTVPGNEFIGRSGNGTVTQTGGIHNAGYLWLGGYGPGFYGTGTYNLSGGTLTTTGFEQIGLYGNGTFNQTGGTHVSRTIFLDAVGATRSGSYNFSGGNLTATDSLNWGAGIHVGGSSLTSGAATFTHTGGTSTVDQLVVGRNGAYNLSGTGSLTAQILDVGLSAGSGGAATFTQTGGTNMVTGYLAVGGSNNVAASYNLGGTGSLTANQTWVGGTMAHGPGTFIQTGGSHTVDYLVIGGTNNSGSYTLSGTGSLTANSENIGSSSSGTFTQTGGTHTAGINIGVNGTYNMTGGTFNANWLNNEGNLLLAGGTTTMATGFGNLATGRIEVTNSQMVVNGNAYNVGTIKITDATVTFNGTFTNNGVYYSDPSNNYFTNLVIGEAGYLVGGVGDNFFVSSDFTNNSLQNSLWNTDDATLILNGTSLQNIRLAGADFSWGRLFLGSGASAHFWGNGNSGDALYIGLLDLADGASQLSNIYSDINIYYDINAPENAYLLGQTYALGGGGSLSPTVVPLPTAVWLFGSGLAGLIGFARRKKAG